MCGKFQTFEMMSTRKYCGQCRTKFKAKTKNKKTKQQTNKNTWRTEIYIRWKGTGSYHVDFVRYSLRYPLTIVSGSPSTPTTIIGNNHAHTNKKGREARRGGRLEGSRKTLSFLKSLKFTTECVGCIMDKYKVHSERLLCFIRD